MQSIFTNKMPQNNFSSNAVGNRTLKSQKYCCLKLMDGYKYMPDIGGRCYIT